MNPDGHLVDSTYRNEEQLSKEGYKPVPKRLRKAAIKELNGQTDTHIDIHTKTKLAKHARYLRKKQKQLKAKNRNIRRRR